MGLLYTKTHLDFDENDWKEISSNPIIFQTLNDDVTLEIETTSQKLYKLNFKKNGKLNMFRVTGQFRLTWNDEDIL